MSVKFHIMKKREYTRSGLLELPEGLANWSKEGEENNKNETKSGLERSPSNINNYHGRKKVLKFVSIIILICISYYYIHSGNFVPTRNKNLLNVSFLYDQMDKISSKFPSQSKRTWQTFIHGIKGTVYNGVPASFLLLHNGNKGTAECIVSHVGNLTRVFLNRTEGSLCLTASEELRRFRKDKMEITKYRMEIKRKSVVEIRDFEMFPAEIAKHFHSICDVYNPIVKQAVFFFIMDTKSNEVKLASRARNSMLNVWSGSLLDHELEPLVTRLSEYIVEILPDRHDC